VPHGLYLADGRAGQGLKSLRKDRHLVHMGGPGLEPGRKALQDVVLLYDLHIHLGISTHAAWDYLSAEGGAHKLHSQADSQNGDLQLSQIILASPCPIQGGAPSQNQAVGIDLLRRGLVGDQVRLHLLPDGAANQMIELSMIVDYQNAHCYPLLRIMKIYLLAIITNFL